MKILKAGCLVIGALGGPIALFATIFVPLINGLKLRAGLKLL